MACSSIPKASPPSTATCILKNFLDIAAHGTRGRQRERRGAKPH